MKLRRIAWIVGAMPLLAVVGFLLLPPPAGLLSREAIVSTRIVDREGGLLRELRSRADGRGQPLPAEEELPPRVVAAFVAAEDGRFWLHPGIDPLAVARAAWQNLRAGRVVSGASTIPQQLARQLVPRERTFRGKAGEALWALRLSLHHSKEEVLRAYLDRVPLGHATHGVESAARLYFGRPAARLSLGQAATLAALARSPSRLDPFRHPERSRRAMGRVLTRMVEAGLISEEERILAERVPLELAPRESIFRAPHLVAALSRTLQARGLDAASEIVTTLDPALQADVEELVADELAALVDHRVSAAAVLVVDNESGDILAWVGSADFFDDAAGGQNDGVLALRQPGSALKPFAYGAALVDGATAATVLSDVEVHLDTPTGAWSPRNYDRRSHGPVRLRVALQSSYNVPAVRIAERIGTERLLKTLRRAGFRSLDDSASHYGAGLVLGNGDVSLFELAAAYRGLASGGVWRPLREVLEARDSEGERLQLPPPERARRFLPADATALLTDILSDEAARVPAFGLDNALRLPFPVAAKTGTSRAYVDNWTAGFTKERTVVVWVGNFDGSPMRGVSGITGAGPLFRRVMMRAMEGITPAPLVDRGRFVHAEICPLSGALAGPACPSRADEIFLPGTEPFQECRMHRLVAVDAEGRVRGCDDGQGRLEARLDVGPGFYGWARAEGLGSVPLPPCGEASAAPSAAPRLLLPGDGDEYLIEPGIPLADQQIPVRVALPPGVPRAELRLGNGRVVPLEAPFHTLLPAEPGVHRVELWLPGASGPADRARFSVR